jgi:hypothetical protein
MTSQDSLVPILILVPDTNGPNDIFTWSETHSYLVTSSWEGEKFRCTNCTTGHSLLVKGLSLFLSITDQHALAQLLSPETICVASYRMSNTTLKQFNTHLFKPILSAEGMAVNMDKGGSVDLLQGAMNIGMRIWLVGPH